MHAAHQKFITLAFSALISSPLALAGNPFATMPKADDVFYHIMPIAWRDGPDSDATDPQRFGDFQGMANGLGYLDDLGITAMWMNPVFPSPAYHGYQHGRADQINPWFGTESQFTSFVEDAHSLGIEVYIDFVVYGISHNSPWYNSAFGNPASQYDDWLAFWNTSNTNYQGYTFNTWNGDSVGFIHWDLRTQDATDLVTDWALKWLDPNNDGDFSDGVDGYRLDHVWVNYGDGPNGWGYNLNDFWTHWHTALRAKNPDVFTFCEQHNWGSHGTEFLPQFDAAMTKPFEFAARDALRNEDAGPLEYQMQETINAFLASGRTDDRAFVAIIGDHDVDRLSSSIGADTSFREGRAHAAAAMLMLQPFPPIIYYGDEIGMLGFKQDYGSDANDIPFREPFKWNAVEGAPMTRYHELNFQATVNQYSSDNDGRSVEEQQGSGLLQTYKDLIDLRHDSVALRRGSYHAIDDSQSSVWAFARLYEQGDAPIPDASQSLACVINLARTSRNVTLDLSEIVPVGSNLNAFDLVSGNVLPNITSANASSYSITIPGYSYIVIEADFQRPPEPSIVVDGQLDDAYTLLDSNTGVSLWGAYENGFLHLATNPAQDGRDRFIVISQNPSGSAPAMWAKLGTVASYDAYIGNEVDNGWSGWFDAVSSNGPVAGAVLEGSIDLGAQYSSIPETIGIASLPYFTNDGDSLDPAFQVPAGNGDLNVQASEFLIVDLANIEIGTCPADFTDDGTLDFFDVSAFLSAFGASDPAADFNGDGNFDFFDVSAFLAAFGAGCP